MIFQIAREGNEWTAQEFLRNWGSELATEFRTRMFHELADATALPIGTYLFCDIEIASQLQRRILGQVWDQLESHGGCRLFNHPLRTLGRFDLLKALEREGINDFRAFHLEDLREDVRFPVFVRIESDHWGSRTPLLTNAAELDRWLVKAALGGNDPSQILVTEFCDTREASDGLYRKYSCFCIDGHIVPRHVHFGTNWMLKMPEYSDPSSLAEESRYMDEVPHQEEIRHIFGIANVDYGRMDYAYKDGKIQVWEINTNPTLTLPEGDYPPAVVPTQKRFAALMVEALRNINSDSSGEPAPVGLGFMPML